MGRDAWIRHAGGHAGPGQPRTRFGSSGIRARQLRPSAPGAEVGRTARAVRRLVMVTLKRILVATDFGEAADVAFAYGRELARTFGAALDVLHVADNVFARGLPGEGHMLAYPDLQREVENTAGKRLEALISDEDRTVLHATAVVRTSTSPALAIVDYARDARVDLIIMGTHGRGAMAHLLMGSVAERVVRTAPCPVLTVRHPEHEFVLPDALVRVANASGPIEESVSSTGASGATASSAQGT